MTEANIIYDIDLRHERVNQKYCFGKLDTFFTIKTISNNYVNKITFSRLKNEKC